MSYLLADSCLEGSGKDSPYMDASEFDEHIIRNFTAAASRLRHVNRRRRQRSAGIGPSQVHLSLPEDFQYFGTEPSQVNSEVYIPSAFFIDPTPPNMSPSAGNVVSHTIGTRNTTVEARQQPPGSPPSSNLSESVSFPESIKSKISAASASFRFGADDEYHLELSVIFLVVLLGKLW